MAPANRKRSIVPAKRGENFYHSVPFGNYSITALLKVLNTYFDASGKNIITFDYDQITNKIILKFKRGRIGGDGMTDANFFYPSINPVDNSIYKILKKIRKTLPKEKSLIGFAGSPWTLLTYMINKGSPKKNIKSLKNLKKKEVIKIIKRLEHLIYIHCKEQILAGADIIQLFDSWAGLIEKKNLKEFCINPNKNIVNKIKKNFPNNPVICFPKGINKNINNFIKEVNPHCISIDYDINLKNLNLNNDVVFQGGMNPKFLLGNNKRMFKEAKKYLDFFKNKPYIFNLGHGILPKTKPENVKRLVEFVRSYNL